MRGWKAAARTTPKMHKASGVRTNSREPIKPKDGRLRDGRRGAAAPGREDSHYGPRGRGCGDDMHQNAQAYRSGCGRRRRFLGQELTDRTLAVIRRTWTRPFVVARRTTARLAVMAVGRFLMRGRESMTAIAVARPGCVIMEQPRRGDRQHIGRRHERGNPAFFRPSAHRRSDPYNSTLPCYSTAREDVKYFAHRHSERSEESPRRDRDSSLRSE